MCFPWRFCVNFLCVKITVKLIWVECIQHQTVSAFQQQLMMTCGQLKVPESISKLSHGHFFLHEKTSRYDAPPCFVDRIFACYDAPPCFVDRIFAQAYPSADFSWVKSSSDLHIGNRYGFLMGEVTLRSPQILLCCLDWITQAYPSADFSWVKSSSDLHIGNRCGFLMGEVTLRSPQIAIQRICKRCHYVI